MRRWFRYTRLRLWARQAEGWVRFWVVRACAGAHVGACKLAREQVLPVLVGMGEMDLWKGLEGVRRFESREEGWKEWGREQMFLGASKDHPEGIYARGGDDMVGMTEDEYGEWYG